VDDLGPERRALLAFVHDELEPGQLREFGFAVAHGHGVTYATNRPRGAMRDLVGQLTPAVASRYLAELVRRKTAGEPFVRAHVASDVDESSRQGDG
jgi:hypothetical protein